MKQVLSLLLVVLGACSAQAQLIGVQFLSNAAGASYVPATAVTGVIPQEYFNDVAIGQTGAFSASNLFTSTDVKSGVSVSVTGDTDNNYTGTNTSPFAGTPGALLLSGQSGGWQSASPIFTLSGLAAGQYDLVIYAEGNGSMTEEFSLTKGTTSSPSSYFIDFQTGSSYSGTFIQSTATTAAAATTQANYVEFLNVSPDSSGHIQFQMPNGVNVDNWAPVSGLQVEAVPEPSTLVLMSLAALLLPALAAARRFLLSV